MSSIALPSNLSRMGLSEIVNSLLESVNSEFQRAPFDFLIDGELIRMPLEDFLLAKGISAERILEIEYIRAVVPRKTEGPLPHDDWVSSIDGSNSSFILTGCYDKYARVWKDGSVCTHILEGHKDAITSVHVINKRDSGDQSMLFAATASRDRSLRLWKLSVDDYKKHPKKLTSFKLLKGHAQSIQSISSVPSGNMLCSGSWDSSIKIWKVDGDETESDLVSLKKRKVKGDDDQYLEESQLEGESVSTLSGHTQSVSGVVWPELQTLYSCSWDHSIRIWDVQTGQDSWSMVSERAYNCLDVGGEGSALVAAGGSDPILRVWDPRKPGTVSPIHQFSFHKSWISSCKWHKRSWYHLISASYDGTVMLWDLRTLLPLAVINSHTDKVLCVDWWKDENVISGGADSKLCISSGISI